MVLSMISFLGKFPSRQACLDRGAQISAYVPAGSSVTWCPGSAVAGRVGFSIVSSRPLSRCEAFTVSRQICPENSGIIHGMSRKKPGACNLSLQQIIDNGKSWGRIVDIVRCEFTYPTVGDYVKATHKMCAAPRRLTMA